MVECNVNIPLVVYERIVPPVFEKDLMTTTRPVAIDAFRLPAVLESGSAPRLIDVRTRAELASMHTACSYNVPLDLLRDAQMVVADLAGCPAERAKAG